jgi:hypothetical protein
MELERRSAGGVDEALAAALVALFGWSERPAERRDAHRCLLRSPAVAGVACPRCHPASARPGPTAHRRGVGGLSWAALRDGGW